MQGEWKSKFQEMMQVCQEELKKTTEIGKKMLTASKANSDLKEAYEELGIYIVAETRKGNLNLEHVLKRVKELGFYRIFLESGIKLASSFIKDNLVNDLKIFMSNDKLNNNGSGSLNGYLKSFIKKNKYTVEKVNLFGDKLISYKIK